MRDHLSGRRTVVIVAKKTAFRPDERNSDNEPGKQ